MAASNGHGGRISRPAATEHQQVPARPAPRGRPLALPTIGRWNDNELILFREEQRESWIVYPPRSAYEFVERPSRDVAVVELRSWAPLTEPEYHPLHPSSGCLFHGLDCAANAAIQAAVDSGYNPFS